jgi:hypothetical protein
METTLELNEPERMGFELDRPLTPNTYFQKLFPAQTRQFGPAFLQLRETNLQGKTIVDPISINIDFFASILSDPALNLSVVYFEPEMQFYYAQPFQPIYKPTSPEKLQCLYRGFLLKAAQSFNNDVNILNLFVEFRSDKAAKQVVNRAKSILAADQSYFSASSKHQRIRGIELHERVARKFVDELLTSEPGQILRLADAYAVFRGLLKERDLPDIKRSDFKAVVGPLITSSFNVALRNDLDGAGGRGWKNVRLIQSKPG